MSSRKFTVNLKELKLLFLYAVDKCLVFQNKNAKDIKKKLNEDFANIWDWFVDSKLIGHFDKEKNMSILFTSKRKIKKLQKLDIIYNNIRIKQHSWLLVVIISRTLSEWIYTLWLPECQGTPCSKKARYLKFKWQQRESNPQPINLSRHTQSFSHTS